MSDQILSPAAAGPHAAAKPHELLQQLAGWMSASGYGGDHPWRVAIAATLAESSTPGTTARPLHRDCGDRLLMELRPVLSGLAMLTNAVRVLEELQDSASLSPAQHEHISAGCPTWCDPICHGGDNSAASVVCELARYADQLCGDLIAEDQNGGAA